MTPNVSISRKSIICFLGVLLWTLASMAFAQKTSDDSCEQSISDLTQTRKNGTTLLVGKKHTGCLDGVPYVIFLPRKWEAGDPLMMHMYGYWPTVSTDNVLDDYGVAAAAWTSVGYAVAISKSVYGWVPYRRMEDTEKLRVFFIKTFGEGKNSYPSVISGFSMGGMQTFFLAEKEPTYDGALPMCAFSQSSYDFLYNRVFNYRVLFDHFFPSLLKGSAVEFPQGDKTLTKTCNKIRDYIVTGAQSPFCAPKKWPAPWQNLSTSDLDQFNQATQVQSIDQIPPLISLNSGLLWELSERYNGNIFDNTNEIYLGGLDPDPQIPRYTAVAKFDQEVPITGKIKKPVLAMHTTIDGNIPVSMTQHYQSLTYHEGTSDHFVQLYANRTGHCMFYYAEMKASLQLLDDWIQKGERPQPGNITNGKLIPN